MPVKIKKIPIEDQGACNFCQRGNVKKNGMGLEYPYDSVWIIAARHISVRACDDCMKKIISLYQKRTTEREA